MSWTEDESRSFLEYADLFVPDRETQVDAICSLVDPAVGSGEVVELCCGDGTLAAALLERHPRCRVLGLDGSPAMLERARTRLAPAGDRFHAEAFDLQATEWRGRFRDCTAVVTSLTVHHLPDPDKQRLFSDVAGLLAPGGVFVLADVMQPATPAALELAARQWDEAVRARSQQRYGDDRGLDAFRKLEWNLWRHPDPEVDHPGTLSDQLTWLAAAGLHPVDAVWAHAGHAILAGTHPTP